MSDQVGLLSGLKVLDLTHYVAGPYATRLMAAQGADVIKVERPGTGDPARGMGPFPEDVPHPEKSALFLYLNTESLFYLYELICQGPIGGVVHMVGYHSR